MEWKENLYFRKGDLVKFKSVSKHRLLNGNELAIGFNTEMLDKTYVVVKDLPEGIFTCEVIGGFNWTGIWGREIGDTINSEYLEKIGVADIYEIEE